MSKMSKMSKIHEIINESEIKQVEEKEPKISKHLFKIYSTTDKTLKEVAAATDVAYSKVNYYCTKYKYIQRLKYYNIQKPKKKKQYNNRSKEENISATNNNEYHRFILDKQINITVTLSEKEYYRIKKKAAKQNTSIEVYITEAINDYYSNTSTELSKKLFNLSNRNKYNSMYHGLVKHDLNTYDKKYFRNDKNKHDKIQTKLL